MQCHGSFSRATCLRCAYTASLDDLRDSLENQEIPRCPRCGPPGRFDELCAEQPPGGDGGERPIAGLAEGFLGPPAGYANPPAPASQATLGGGLSGYALRARSARLHAKRAEARSKHASIVVEEGDDSSWSDGAILKPDIVFFGEPLGESFAQSISRAKAQCDLLIVMGSSLSVGLSTPRLGLGGFDTAA